MQAARPTIDQLNKFSQGTPELGKNLAIVLEHLNDRDHSVEEDPRSPGGKGYTGLEALLQYVYDQALSTNVFDSNSHFLSVAPFRDNCSDYADAKRAKDPANANCIAALGPNQPGINFTDPTDDGTAETRATRRRARARHTDGDAPPPASEPGAPAQQEQPKQSQGDGKPSTAVPLPATPSLPPINPPKLPDVLPGPGLPKVELPGGTKLLGNSASGQRGAELLDYLLKP
jgi:hypothetical protein